MVGGAKLEKPRHVSNEFAEDMRRMGLSEEIATAPTEDDVQEPLYEIWPENLQALNFFLELENQWDIVVSPDGELIRICIKTQAIEFKMKYQKHLRKKEHADLVEKLGWMERAALVVMNKARFERVKQRADELEQRR